MRYLLTLLFILGFLIPPHPSYAEDAVEATPDIPKPLKVMPAKIHPVQSSADELSKAAADTPDTSNANTPSRLDLLTPRNGYGFPANFWENSSGKNIVDFLSLPVHILQNPTVRDMALRATLTLAPNLSAGDDINKNIYALRLQHLADMGNFKDGVTLYQLNESHAPNALAARAGVESILGNGAMGMACLEEKAMDNSLKSDTPEFWKNLDMFCQTLLGAVVGDNDSLRLSNAARIFADANRLPQNMSVAEFNQADMVTAIALIKTHRITGVLDTPASLAALNDRNIALLLSYMDEESVSRLPVLATAIERGLISYPDAISETQKIKPPSDSDIYAPFLSEYKLQSTPLVTAKLLNLATSPILESLLIPLYAASETSIPDTNKLISVKMLLAANQSVPASLVQGAFSTPDSAENLGESGEILLISHLLSQTSPDNIGRYNILLALKTAFTQENINKSLYDNNFNLTASDNYVMPNAEILSSLRKSAEQKQMNQVVVESLKILTGTPADKLHPAALYRIFKALNSAGLTEETQSLARHVLRILLEKKE